MMSGKKRKSSKKKKSMKSDCGMKMMKSSKKAEGYHSGYYQGYANAPAAVHFGTDTAMAEDTRISEKNGPETLEDEGAERTAFGHAEISENSAMAESSSAFGIDAVLSGPAPGVLALVPAATDVPAPAQPVPLFGTSSIQEKSSSDSSSSSFGEGSANDLESFQYPNLT
jgi:hypothetical protein